MVMSDDDYTMDQHDLLLMMAEHLIATGAHAIAPLRCDYGHCERSKGRFIDIYVRVHLSNRM